jgi:hypothetical protein
MDTTQGNIIIGLLLIIIALMFRKILKVVAVSNGTETEKGGEGGKPSEDKHASPPHKIKFAS